MDIETRRIFGDDSSSGYRVLVDRLWPRGISKAEAALDDWWKELAPSSDLRQWFDHDPARWSEFRRRYLGELADKREQARTHLGEVTGRKLVLLYGAKDAEHNHARVLKEYLGKLKP